MVYPFYAVRVGKKPSIYTSWETAKKQVSGFSNVEYKGFRCQEDATRWLDLTGDEVSVLVQHMQDITGSLDGMVQNLHISSMTGAVPNGESSQHSSKISGGEIGEYIFVKNMEVMLLRICSSLNVGPPIFFRREGRSKEGLQQVGFAVVMPSNSQGLNITVEGNMCHEESDARQDASFRMIERLLAETGTKIMDYNYRVPTRVFHNLLG